MKMKEILNEWKEFLNKAQHINEEQKDPDKVSQARTDGTLDAQDAGNRGDKWEGGPYFEFYNDSYNNELDMQDREDYYDDLDDDSNEEEVALSSFDKRKQQIAKIHDGFVDFLEVEDIFPMGEIPKSVMDALMKAAMLAVDAMENDLDERCQKGYKTHPTTKTKKMYGKTYRNCVKAEE
jgi:hypothetical protein